MLYICCVHIFVFCSSSFDLKSAHDSVLFYERFLNFNIVSVDPKEKFHVWKLTNLHVFDSNSFP